MFDTRSMRTFTLLTITASILHSYSLNQSKAFHNIFLTLETPFIDLMKNNKHLYLFHLGDGNGNGD